MIDPVVVQGIGLAGLLIAVSTFQINKRKTMLILGMSACLLWSLHFLFLGAITGAAMNLIGAGRSYAFYRVRPSKRNRWVLWSFLGLLAAATVVTWQNTLSLLPFIASIFNEFAYWQKRPKNIRRLSLASSPLWFTYNMISGSYPGMAVEVMLMTSNLIGQYRFDFKHTYHHKLLRFAKPA